MYDSARLAFSCNFSRTFFLSRNSALTIRSACGLLVRLRGRNVKPPPWIAISQYTLMGQYLAGAVSYTPHSLSSAPGCSSYWETDKKNVHQYIYICCSSILFLVQL